MGGSGTGVALLSAAAAELGFWSLAPASGGFLLQPSSGAKARASDEHSAMEFRRMLAGGIEVIHPKTLLGQLAGPDKVDYVVKAEDDAPGAYQCIVRVGDVDVVTVGGCLTKSEAVVRAADAGVKVMSARKRSHRGIS